MKPEQLPGKVSLEELKRSALEHYEDVATKSHHWNSFVPKAIEAYTEWISVSDQLPDNGQTILFWTTGFTNNRLCFGTFMHEDHFGRKNIFCDGSFFSAHMISHWRPAPQHPGSNP